LEGLFTNEEKKYETEKERNGSMKHSKKMGGRVNVGSGKGHCRADTEGS
jgi:hypothetical protein